MIEKVKHSFVSRSAAYSGPTLDELLDKINELVEAVNRMEKQIEKLQVL